VDSPCELEGVGSQLRHSSAEVENGSPQMTPDPFSADLPEDDAPPDYVATNLRRCQGCGGMVYQWPCLTCRLRAPLAGTKPGPGELTHDHPCQ
jgi:hypothetical protein